MKVVAYKILPQQALGVPMPPVGHGVCHTPKFQILECD
jgi:hypothetical protein